MFLKEFIVGSTVCVGLCSVIGAAAAADSAAVAECHKPQRPDWCAGYLEFYKTHDAKPREKTASRPTPVEKSRSNREASDRSVANDRQAESRGASAHDLSQWIFLRSDNLDNRFEAFSGVGTAAVYGGGGAQGASFSYTDDRQHLSTTGKISPTQNIMVTGIASFPLLYLDPNSPSPKSAIRPNDSDWAFAPVAWVSDHGTYDRPTKAFGEQSALLGGVDLMFAHQDTFLGTEVQYLIVSPYLQTDNYFYGRSKGVSLAAEAVQPDWYLGAPSGPNNGYINGYVALRPEATFLSVDIPGETNLMRRDYEWFGGTARAYVYLFPSCPPRDSVASCTTWVPPLLRDRISLIGTAQYFWDPEISRAVRYYSAQIQYNLSGEKTNGTPIDGANPARPQPTAAVSLEYDYGVDRDMLVHINRYLIKLNLKY
jgi:hypothetical protein